jgi:hypothetical protein
MNNRKYEIVVDLHSFGQTRESNFAVIHAALVRQGYQRKRKGIEISDLEVYRCDRRGVSWGVWMGIPLSDKELSDYSYRIEWRGPYEEAWDLARRIGNDLLSTLHVSIITIQPFFFCVRTPVRSMCVDPEAHGSIASTSFYGPAALKFAATNNDRMYKASPLAYLNNEMLRINDLDPARLDDRYEVVALERGIWVRPRVYVPTIAGHLTAMFETYAALRGVPTPDIPPWEEVPVS